MTNVPAELLLEWIGLPVPRDLLAHAAEDLQRDGADTLVQVRRMAKRAAKLGKRGLFGGR